MIPASLYPIRTIQRAVCARYGVTRAQLTGRCRGHEATRARQVAMWLARDLTGASSTAIGRAFGRDHTTVLHAIRQVRRRRAADVVLEGEIRLLSARLRARLADSGRRARDEAGLLEQWQELGCDLLDLYARDPEAAWARLRAWRRMLEDCR